MPLHAFVSPQALPLPSRPPRHSARSVVWRASTPSFKPSELPRFALRILTRYTGQPRVPGDSFASFPNHDRPPVRNAHIAVLTDFSANPILAVRDRATDPVFAGMLLVAALLGFIVARFSAPRSAVIAPAEGTASDPDAASLPQDAAANEVTDDGADAIPFATVPMQPPPSPRPSPPSSKAQPRWMKMKKKKKMKPDQLDDGPVDAADRGISDASPSPPSPDSSTVVYSAVWLTMSIRTLWRLFRKSTASLTRDVIQPVLDNLVLPNYIRSIKIAQLSLGESPPLLRDVRRIPSRALAEMQYRFSFRLTGDKDGYINLRVAVRIPGLPGSIVVPVRVSNIDIDARVWLAVTFVPYAPWVRFLQWAFDDLPSANFSIAVANAIPITAIPILSTLLKRVLTVDLPRQFMFPKVLLTDFLAVPGNEADAGLDLGLLDARGVTLSSGDNTDDELRAAYPRLSALFDTLDVSGDGKLNKSMVALGLVEWGFASEADQNSIVTLLDVNSDGFMQLREFLSVWGDLQNVFVPRKFRGVVNGVLLTAEGLRTPLIGWSDPYVVFRIEDQTAASKKNLSSTQRTERKGFPAWNEGWELYVQQPRTAELRVEVREGSPWAIYRDRVRAPLLSSTHSGSKPQKSRRKEDKLIASGSIAITELTVRNQRRRVEMTAGRGFINIDVQFNEFVDPQYTDE